MAVLSESADRLWPTRRRPEALLEVALSRDVRPTVARRLIRRENTGLGMRRLVRIRRRVLFNTENTIFARISA
jgi:hypothetical protein